MPIGGVIAADGVVIPNAVGVDIGLRYGTIPRPTLRWLISEEVITGNVPPPGCHR